MDPENPYASPLYMVVDHAPASNAPLDVDRLNGAKRWGNYLVVRRDAELPALCMKCGLPADGPLHRVKLKWTDVWRLRTLAVMAPTVAGLAILLLNQSIYTYLLFIGLCFVSHWIGNRYVQRATVYFRRCERHEAGGRTLLWLALLLAGAGAPAFVTGVAISAQGNYDPVGATTVLFVFAALAWGTAILCAARISASVEAHRIEGELVWLKDLPIAFLRQIPELSEAELLAWRQLHAADDAN